MSPNSKCGVGWWEGDTRILTFRLYTCIVKNLIIHMYFFNLRNYKVIREKKNIPQNSKQFSVAEVSVWQIQNHSFKQLLAPALLP